MCVNMRNVRPSKAARAVMIVTCIEEVPGSNRGRNVDYLEVFHAFPHFLFPS